MLCYDRIDVSEVIDLNGDGRYVNVIISIQDAFLDTNFRFPPKETDLMMKGMSFNERKTVFSNSKSYKALTFSA